MMKAFTAIFTIILILTTWAEASANAAPANDSFSGATTLALDGASIGVTTANTEATKEAGEPDHAENAGGKSVWFNFTPQTTMVARIYTMQTNFDTLLAVYTGSSVNNLTPLGSNDNCSNTCEGASNLDLMLVGGQTYRIAVDGADYGAGAGSGTFRLVIFSLAGPAQDNFDTAYDLGNGSSGSIAGTNYNATVEPGEESNQGSGYPARKSVWYRWRSGGNYSVDFELKENFNSMMSVWSSNTQNPTLAQLQRVTFNSDGFGHTFDKYRLTFYAQSAKYYFIQIDTWTNSEPTAGNFQLRFRPHRFDYSSRINVSENSTIALFRPSTGVWYWLPDFGLPSGKTFGLAGDVPVPADYDGDGFTDLAVTRSENGKKMWYYQGSGNGNNYVAAQWGLDTDKPIIGEFDNDGRADLAVIRQTAGGLQWYVRNSADASMRVLHWGVNTDKPVLGDFDGDGLTDATVARAQNGSMVWYFLKSSYTTGTPYTQMHSVQFGLSGDIPAVADFDGDLKTDIAVFRPANGTWYIWRSTDGQMRATQFGTAGDIPQPADYDGDGRASVGVFRPSNGTWYTSTDPATNYGAVKWGTAGDVPLTSLSMIAQ